MRYRGNAKISVSTDVLTKVCDIKGLLLKRNIEKLGNEATFHTNLKLL